MARSRTQKKRLRSFVCVAVPLVLAGSVSVSRAEPNPEKARVLFQQAKALRTAGRYDAACVKFEESLALDVGVGTEFNLADCWEHVNRTASAYELFLEVAEHATALQQQDRASVAKERADALASKLVRLALDLGTPQKDLEVRLDGKVVVPKEWADGRAIDPGRHEIHATAPHKVPWSVAIDAPPSSGETITVSVPQLESERGASPVAAAPRASHAAPPPDAPKEAPPPAEAKPSSNEVSPVLKYGLYAGVGAGLVLAGASLAIYKSTDDEARGICPVGAPCSKSEIQRHAELVDNAQMARGLAYVGFGVAGASLATAAIVALTHGKPEKPAVAAPVVAPGLVGAAVHGRF